MTVILEAVAGPVTGRRIEVRAGSILRIGRTARADYALSEDAYLSGVHFAVECDGSQARIRDAGSSNGTFVNGAKVTDQVVSEGDTVSAGGSTFRIHLDLSGTPSSVDSALSRTAPTAIRTNMPPRMEEGAALGATVSRPMPSWPGYSPAQAGLLDCLFRSGEPVFALLHAARDSRIRALVEACGEPYLLADPSGRIPAYVLAPGPKSRLLDVLIKDGWGRGWGVYFSGPTDLNMAATQIASVLTLYTVHGQPVAMPLWDGRLLRILAPLMTPEDAATLFGVFTRAVIEGETPGSAVELIVTPRGVQSQPVLV